MAGTELAIVGYAIQAASVAYTCYSPSDAPIRVDAPQIGSDGGAHARRLDVQAALLTVPGRGKVAFSASLDAEPALEAELEVEK